MTYFEHHHGICRKIMCLISVNKGISINEEKVFKEAKTHYTKTPQKVLEQFSIDYGIAIIQRRKNRVIMMEVKSTAQLLGMSEDELLTKIKEAYDDNKDKQK